MNEAIENVIKYMTAHPAVCYRHTPIVNIFRLYGVTDREDIREALLYEKLVSEIVNVEEDGRWISLLIAINGYTVKKGTELFVCSDWEALHDEDKYLRHWSKAVFPAAKLSK